MSSWVNHSWAVLKRAPHSQEEGPLAFLGSSLLQPQEEEAPAQGWGHKHGWMVPPGGQTDTQHSWPGVAQAAFSLSPTGFPTTPLPPRYILRHKGLCALCQTVQLSPLPEII